MAYITHQKIGITAISACVPKKIMHNSDLGYLIPENEIEKVIKNVGIVEKRYADENTCASDLCYKAALKLFEDNHIDPATIDGLIFVTQTPDFKVPATAPSLQHRLGLKQSCLTFDVTMACSGYVYGLSIAQAIVNQTGINKVLLLVGDTISKLISQRDKHTIPLFGDAGTATLVEKGNFPDSYFSLNSDGNGADIMLIPYGGCRLPSSPEGFIEETDEDGNVITGHNIRMKGMDVFNFGIRVVGSDIKNLLTFCNMKTEDLDLLIFHQANRFMNDFFAKLLKIPKEKTPYSMSLYGNTSSASVPLTIVAEMYDETKYPNRDKVLMSGFGAGLSWGTSLVSLANTKISQLIEY